MKIINLALVGIVLLVAENNILAESVLATKTGNEFGASLSSYQYHEPWIMSNKGAKIGIDARTNKVLQNDLFLRGDLRFAIGTVDYSSVAGNMNGQLDWYIEGRGLVGKDWTVGESEFSPYTGLGYRHLFNDMRGRYPDGSLGYRRESNYLYLPIGIIHRIALDEQARLVSEVEYDQLLIGMQISKWSDMGVGYSDVTNFQRWGYGMKVSVRYEKDNWAFGPYAFYWNLSDSNGATLYMNGLLVYANGMQVGLHEPTNNTVEVGLKFSRQF